MSTATLTGSAKLNQVSRLLEELRHNLSDGRLSDSCCQSYLEELKIYGRDPSDATPIFAPEALATLSKYAFESAVKITSQNALRCLANALLLNPPARQMFVDLQYQAAACKLLNSGNADDEFLVARILFLTTYGTDIDLTSLIKRHDLAAVICQVLQRHADLRIETQPHVAAPSVMEDMALTEVLKLHFNITHFCAREADAFSPTLLPILQLVNNIKLDENISPMIGSASALVNALMSLDFNKIGQTDDATLEAIRSVAFHNKLIDLFRITLSKCTPEQADVQLSPLLTLIRKLYLTTIDTIQDIYKVHLLPNKDDRKEILGQSQSMPSQLLKLSTAPLAPQSREIASDLLFELSDRDAKTLVDNIGYGFASSYLFQHKISLPENTLNSSTSDLSVNPITGQRLDMESACDGPEMTQAEKEREAERLMVLFDRMKRSGIIDVANPVHKAQHEGRFEELNSDEESD